MSFSTLFFYVRYSASYRDLEAIMEERGVKVDHSTLNLFPLWKIKIWLPTEFQIQALF